MYLWKGKNTPQINAEFPEIFGPFFPDYQGISLSGSEVP